ncbi:MAG: hypothetical protein K6A29_11580 [Lachnospiraceae bacterium]|nr:hypothetical protein [Lachnospiraceae bacterium]
MPWCPKCKLEYVEGKTICPDCNVELVEKLNEEEESFEPELVNDLSDEVTKALEEEMPQDIEKLSTEEMEAIMLRAEQLKNFEENPVYKSKKDKLLNNKSAYGVLIVSGFLGLAVIILDIFGVITLPLAGSSRTLTFIVLGVLFLVFLLTGFVSLGSVKRLKPEVEKEEKLINDIVEFIKQNKAAGTYKKPNPENYESEYLELNNKVVSDVKEAFPDLEPGFAYYVVDRFAGDILDED